MSEENTSRELADLAARAGAVDSETAPAQYQSVGMGAPGAVPGSALVVQDARAEMKGQIAVLLSILAGVASELFPKLEKVWTSEAIENIADKAAAVALKRGWSAGFLGKWEAEIMLGVALMPLVKPTLDAVQEEQPKVEKPVQGERLEKTAPASVPVTEKKPSEDDVLRRSVTVEVK